MILDEETNAARKLLAQLSEIEEMQAYKMTILRTANACDESAHVVGSYVDTLITEYRMGAPTAQNIEALRQLNQIHGRVLMAVVRLRAEVAGIYESAEKWMQLSRGSRQLKNMQMKLAMDKALEIAAAAKVMHEESETLGEVVRSWTHREQRK